MNNSLFIKNTVQPSPWESNAPRGYHYHPKKLRLSHFNVKPTQDLQNIKAQDNKKITNRNRNIVQESSMLRNLNRSTLILSFPHINPIQIDAALALSDNDLGEAINLLRLRERILKNRKAQREQRSVQKHTPVIPPPITINVPKSVKYIPTKYTDVQIVEHHNDIGNNLKIVEVNDNVLKMLQTYNTPTPRPSTTTQYKHILPKIDTASLSNRDSAFSEFEFSPTNSSTTSVYSDKLKVGNFFNCPEKQDCNVVSPNKILEQALTF